MIPATKEEAKIVKALLFDSGMTGAINIKRDPDQEVYFCEVPLDEFVGADS